jgi:flavin reductase (DIM6/NTAB) family NADH-FMN oxidoreductase RutF
MVIDRLEYRRAIGAFATGVTVITTRRGEEIHGMTANSLTSVSLDPLLLLICVDRRARMAGLLMEGARFAVNMLSDRQEAISRHFAGRPQPDIQISFADLDGVPAIPETLSTLACTVEQVHDGGDHTIVVGRVDALTRAPIDLPPLLYFAGRYRQLAPDMHPAAPGAEEDFFYHNIISFV